MKTILVRQAGQLDCVERPEAPLALGKLRVRVQFAGVGFADAMAARGGYPLAPRRPFSPGYEFAGVVEALGAGAEGPQPGTRVAGMLPHMACYREFVDLDPRWAVPVPDGLPLETAALMPLNYLTALALTERKAALRPGQSFIIHGAAGGVGTAVLEIARLKRLRAFGTASEAKLSDVAALGATPIPMDDGWLAHALRLEPSGFDAAFDSFGGKLLRECYASLAPGGILVSYGFSPSAEGGYGPFVAGLLFHAGKKLFPGGRRTVTCGTPALIEEDPAWYSAALAECFERAERGQLQPKLFQVFPWEQAATAHRLIAERRVRGKMLLQFS